MGETKFEDHLSIGVSAIVEVIDDSSGMGLPVGSIGMVIDQRPASSHRYKVMIPGNPMCYWYPVSKLRTLQGVDHRNWWMR